MKFTERTTTKKGLIGEQFVKQHLESEGYVVYKAIAEDIAHPFDFVAATKDKKNLLIADVKSKAKRYKYDDTGIDQKHFEQYSFLQTKYNMPVFLYFVDEESSLVYGNYLTELEKKVQCNVTGSSSYEKEYPINNCFGIHYWPLSRMKLIAEIPDDIQTELVTCTTKQEQYKSFDNKQRVKSLLGSQL